jgi:hypothetical protein
MQYRPDLLDGFLGQTRLTPNQDRHDQRRPRPFNLWLRLVLRPERPTARRARPGTCGVAGHDRCQPAIQSRTAALATVIRQKG